MAQPRVLIIEDERTIAALLGKLVESVGAQVELAHNGREGLEKIKAHEPDLILLDLIMPIMSGEELLARLELEGVLERVKVVVVSTKECLEGLEHLQLPQLLKPFEPAEVKRLVREALSLTH